MIINMETTHTIRISNPSKELVAYIEKEQKRKANQMSSMREKFLKTLVP